MSEEVASADSLLKENANLRRALALAEGEMLRLRVELKDGRAALDQAVGSLLAERAARAARDALLDAIAMTTTDDIVRTTIRRAREKE